jgi:hypothetical protein
VLYQNYPNPFNPSTVFNYQLPEQGRVSIKEYDLLDRSVATLADGMKETVYYSVTKEFENFIQALLLLWGVPLIPIKNIGTLKNA